VAKGVNGRGRSRQPTTEKGRSRGLLLGPGHIAPPADLTPEALTIWRELAPEVARLGLIHGAGAGLLAEYCLLSVEWHDLHASLESEGLVIDTPRGMKGNPKWNDLLRLQRRLLRLGDRLGMSPLARARMGLA